jgi:PAS domain-containing protein
MSRATLYDITDRRRAKNRLSVRKRSLLALSAPVPSVFAVTRMSDGRFIEINQAATSFLGYDTDELIGNTTLGLRLWPNPS